MNITRKNFPLALKDKVLENINKRKLNITFLNGAIIESKMLILDLYRRI